MGKQKRFFTLTLILIGVIMAGCSGGGSSSNPPNRVISGSVTSSGTGLQGVKMLLSGEVTDSNETDANGKYSFGGLPDGNYTITPTKSGYADRPRAATRTIKGADIAEVNFAAIPSSPVFYVVDDQGGLGTVDIATSEVRVIGTTQNGTEPIIMTDIAFDENGNLYGISGDKLHRIDKATAAVTPVGFHHLTYATSLVFSNDGTKAFTASSTLFTINTATAETTLLGNGNDAYSSSGDLAFIGNNLYLTSKKADNPDDNYLVKIDTLTGKGTIVGTIGYPDVFGVATSDNVQLYGFSGTRVITINTSTGAGSVVLDIAGKGLGNINGAAFD